MISLEKIWNKNYKIKKHSKLILSVFLSVCMRIIFEL
jgi:hypothetical protein